ncbi:lysosome-associated membrane glycoprotein 1-like [Synchiropus splendidus]|uniref:lysosome-associated membrane glycoprotein 1-like n=1 Tax=Synchiropus splendidus TaxID=270530 RepID=UPI00237E5FCB|nr:lysosome-associated membrane glycoprotein 1-like [Synchiropus splendidus]
MKLCRVQCAVLIIPLVLALLHPSDASEPEPSKPERGLYHVSSNGSMCLLAYMALQFNLTYDSPSMNKTVHNLVNLNPNATTTSGSCDNDSAFLRLSADAEKMNLTFHFSLNTTSNKYHLNEVILTAVWPDTKESFTAQNDSLDYLQGTLGFSYMCREEQTLDVDQHLSINTFQLQVQPFGLAENQFGAAEECQLDEDDMLIPIIVGGALAGLVLIVLLAYLIGRKRSHAGYQTI